MTFLAYRHLLCDGSQGLNLGAVGAATDRRGFVPVDEKMQVLDKAGSVVPHLYCIGDANGKYMLAHAASAQGISAVENMIGRSHVLNHLSVPAACFTHPEVSPAQPITQSCECYLEHVIPDVNVKREPSDWLQCAIAVHR